MDDQRDSRSGGADSIGVLEVESAQPDRRRAPTVDVADLIQLHAGDLLEQEAHRTAAVGDVP
jgi:hypothetical protein